MRGLMRAMSWSFTGSFLAMAVLGTAVPGRAQILPMMNSSVGASGWALTGDLNEPGGTTPVQTGSVTGSVMDGGEAAVPGASITLLRKGQQGVLRVVSGEDGRFTMPEVPSGGYLLHVERAGFVPYSVDLAVAAGQRVEIGEILLGVAASETVEVRASSHDVAEAQVALEEQQRVLGVFPNFYASYAPDAEPLTASQKYRLAWRFSNDPVAFAMAGAVAGVEQPNSFRGYGPGMTGYDKRFGAAYADGFVSTMVGQALLPAVFHQDPRYFVKGTGSLGARAWYAMASMVMCKGDNKRWQVNYSNILGNFAGAGASNLYYPSASRRGFAGVTQVAMSSTALGAVGGLFQEFFLHRMTPRVPDYGVR